MANSDNPTSAAHAEAGGGGSVHGRSMSRAGTVSTSVDAASCPAATASGGSPRSCCCTGAPTP